MDSLGAQRLRRFFADTGETQAAFGARLDAPRSNNTVSRWCGGAREPRRKDKTAIQIATGDVVRAEHWSLPPEPESGAANKPGRMAPEALAPAGQSLEQGDLVDHIERNRARSAAAKASARTRKRLRQVREAAA